MPARQLRRQLGAVETHRIRDGTRFDALIAGVRCRTSGSMPVTNLEWAGAQATG